MISRDGKKCFLMLEMTDNCNNYLGGKNACPVGYLK